MNVVHVVRQYAPAIGGLENFVKSLAEQQSLMGMNVTVLTLNRSFATNEIYPEKECLGGVDIVRIPFRGSYRYPIAFNILAHIPKDSIIHVHCTDFFSDFLALTKPIHRSPLFLSTHGGFFHTKGGSRFKNIYFHTITRLSLLAYRNVFACSVGDFDKFSSITKKVSLIENGVSVERFLKHDNLAAIGNVRFVFVGRLSSNKGLIKLIHTFSYVLKNRKNWSLTIVGNDYDGLAKLLNNEISDLGMTKQIKILPGLTDEQLVGECLRSQFVVSASEYEGFGMAVIEGMAAGLIPIVSNIPSFETIIKNANLGLVNMFRGSADADAIIRFTEETLNRFREDSIRAKEFSQNYSWLNIERTFANQYNKLLGEHLRIIQGVNVSNLTEHEALGLIEERIEAKIHTKLAYANAHTINLANKDNTYLEVLKNFLVLPDGLGVDLASLLKYGRKFKENLNGTDFTPQILSKLTGKRIFLLGAAGGVAKEVLGVWGKEYDQHEWVGQHHGFISDDESAALAKDIKKLNVDVLIVAMGNPKQELWINDYGEATGATLLIGVGALFDFTAGRIDRAPRILQKMRVEWLFRLLKEPVRMWRRYLIGNLVFLIRAWSNK